MADGLPIAPAAWRRKGVLALLASAVVLMVLAQATDLDLAIADRLVRHSAAPVCMARQLVRRRLHAPLGEAAPGRARQRAGPGRHRRGRVSLAADRRRRPLAPARFGRDGAAGAARHRPGQAPVGVALPMEHRALWRAGAVCPPARRTACGFRGRRLPAGGPCQQCPLAGRPVRVVAAASPANSPPRCSLQAWRPGLRWVGCNSCAARTSSATRCGRCGSRRR